MSTYVKFTELPAAAASLVGTEIVPIVSSNTNQRTTPAAVARANEARSSITMAATGMDLWALTDTIDGTGGAVTVTAIANAPRGGATRTLYPTAGSIITQGATFTVEGGASATAASGDAWIIEAITTTTYRVWIRSVAGNGAPSSLYTTGGSGSAYTLTPTPALSALSADVRYRVNFHTPPVGLTPTINVSGLGAVALRYRLQDNSKAYVTPSTFDIGWDSDVSYDGTDWIVEQTQYDVAMPSRVNLCPDVNTWVSLAGGMSKLRDDVLGSIIQGDPADGTVLLAQSPFIPVDAFYNYIVGGNYQLNATSGSIYFDVQFYDINFGLLSTSLNNPAPFTTSVGSNINRNKTAVAVGSPSGTEYAVVRCFTLSGVGITYVNFRQVKLEIGVLPLTNYSQEKDIYLGDRQLVPIAAVPSSNTLVISCDEISLDFRSETLSDGKPVRAYGKPTNLVISSGSTFGSVSAVKSRIAVLGINNAGTIELAAVNVAGGVDLSESGLITTTAEGGAGGADSISTIYSAAARTSKAYRVLGYIESTQATAGTWATTPSLVQGAGGNPIASFGMLRLHTSNGFGSTNTAIRRFTTIERNDSTDFTYADSATLGGTVTILKDGGYVFQFSGNYSAVAASGLSLNSTQLTTSLTTITAADRIAYTITPALNVPATSVYAGVLKAGDVVRAHGDVSAATGIAARDIFTAVRVF